MLRGIICHTSRTYFADMSISWLIRVVSRTSQLYFNTDTYLISLKKIYNLEVNLRFMTNIIQIQDYYMKMLQVSKEQNLSIEKAVTKNHRINYNSE